MDSPNIFANVLGNKRELLHMLDQAREVIKSGEAEIGQIIFETAPSAYNQGHVEDKDQCFFGFAFKKGNGKKRTPNQELKDKTQETKQESESEHMGIINANNYGPVKISSSRAETFRQGVKYVCPCGFTTGSCMGFKKHYNKCDKRKEKVNEPSISRS